MMTAVSDAVDFFVSYTSADRPWAEWIAWELEQAGHSVIVQAWDIQPGANFAVEMEKATVLARRTVAVLSPAYWESPYCRAEWAAAFAGDPDGSDRRLVGVRVREFQRPGLSRALVYIDVVGLSEHASREALLAGVQEKRAKPADSRAFPGAGAVGTRERVRRPEAGAAIFNVPVTTRTFVGRAAALAILARGLGTDGALVVHAIHGLGGIGKTQLAAQHARLHREAYDVVWWLGSAQRVTLRADFARLAVVLGLITGDAEEADAVLAAGDWLERNGRWLLVFDNAPDPEAIADLVPQGCRGHVVITSRAHADWRALGARPVALDVWERHESCGFLVARCDEQEAGALEAVADALGDLPLALEQAAAYANLQAIGLREYVRRLQDRAPELFAAGRPRNYQHTVATVWMMAFEQLVAQPVARQLLRVCTCYAPDRIPRELLAAYVTTPATLEGDAQRTVDEAIEILLGYALLSAAAELTLGMHRLVAWQTREHAGADEQRIAAATAVLLVYEVLPDRPWQPQHWPLCQRLLSHALAAAEHAERHHAALAETARVLGLLAQYVQARGEFTAARELYERAVSISELVYGLQDAEVALMLTGLGTVHQQLGNLEVARSTLERALTIQQAVHGPEHAEVANTLGNLGNVHDGLGDLDAARSTHERALAIQVASRGPEDPEVANALGNLGNVQQRLGEFEAALTSYQRGLAIFETVFGPESPEVALTLTNLGNVQQRLAELDQARCSQERALTIFETLYGPEHPEVAIALNNLGIVQQQLGELETARLSHQRALAIDEAVYGLEHPAVASTLGNLGIVQVHLGDLDAALASQQRALVIEEAVYGSGPAVASTLGNLGTVQEQLGDLDAALASHQRALAIEEAVYGPQHPTVAGTLGNVGIVQEQLGDLDAALASQQRALAIEEAVYGPQHPTVAATLGNLGIVQRQLGKLEAARITQQRALAIEETVYGPDHLAVASTLGNLSNVQQHLGELDAARDNARRALAIFERFLGPAHAHTERARTLLRSLEGGGGRAARRKRLARLTRRER
jgi:tetratricopeptide (TPR) repeat protein